jgi:hypothetical protein
LGIRVARFPGEQCGHHERAVEQHHIRAADVAEIVEVADWPPQWRARAKADADHGGITFAEVPQTPKISKESVPQ